MGSGKSFKRCTDQFTELDLVKAAINQTNLEENSYEEDR